MAFDKQFQWQDPGAEWAALDAQFSDSVDLTSGIPQAIYIGVTGNIVVTDKKGNKATFTAVPVGILPIQPVRIDATGTTVTDVVGIMK